MHDSLFSLLRRGLRVGLLLLLLLLAGCQSTALQEVAGQVGTALEAAATLDAGGSVAAARTPSAATRTVRARTTATAKARNTPTPRNAATRTAIARGTPKPKATATPRPQQGVSGLPTIRYDSLPKQAKQTIALIDKGGPFPFNADGTVFQNRERLLPRKSSGYYREYTVITPGSRDRGARRIIAGAEGELYYTDDHYDSFREVIR
ncbi:MAG: ribonuclease domain-containing protein [Anaerolineae bacterium]